jgi:polyketide synthase PksN
MGPSTPDRPPLDLPHRDCTDPPRGYHRLPVTHSLRTEELVATTAAFLARLTGSPDGEIGLIDGRLPALFTHVVPIGPGDFATHVQNISERCRATPAALPVVVELHADLAAPAPTGPGTALLVRIDATGRCEWHVADPVLSRPSALALLDLFAAFLDSLDGPDPDRCAHQLIGEQPDDRPAVVCGRGITTYGQLNDRARRLAGGLERHGIGPGDLIGVYLPRSSDLAVAQLAVLRTGAAVVPVDPSGPIQRVVDELAPRLVLTDSWHTRLIRGVPRVKLDRLRLKESAPGREHAEPGLTACVLPGAQRSVQIGHHALANLLRASSDTALDVLQPLLTGQTMTIGPIPLPRTQVTQLWDLAQHAS